MLASGLLRLLCAMAVLPLAVSETITMQFRVSPDEAFVLSADSADELSLSGAVKATGYQCGAPDAELCARYSALESEVASLKTQVDVLASSISGTVPDTAAPELLDMEVAEVEVDFQFNVTATVHEPARIFFLVLGVEDATPSVDEVISAGDVVETTNQGGGNHAALHQYTFAEPHVIYIAAQDYAAPVPNRSPSVHSITAGPACVLEEGGATTTCDVPDVNAAARFHVAVPSGVESVAIKAWGGGGRAGAHHHTVPRTVTKKRWWKRSAAEHLKKRRW